MVLGIVRHSVRQLLVGIALAASFVVLAGGCGSGGTNGDGSSGSPTLGGLCVSDSECGPGETCTQTLPKPVVGECTKPCAKDSDCGKLGEVCGVLSDGSRGCLRECSISSTPCVDNVPIACGAAPDAYCEWCGCPAGFACDSIIAGGCIAVHDVGEPCEIDTECKSDNCSRFAHVCRVALGQNCDGTNCDLCRTGPNGYSSCSKECQLSVECGATGDCVGSSGHYTCVQKCTSLSDPSCPGGCDYTSGFEVLYCPCNGCAASAAPLPIGSPCNTDAECDSRFCLSRNLGVAPVYPYRSGVCSKPCASTADCPTGAGCMNIPCETDAASTGDKCGSVCTPTCKFDLCEGDIACLSSNTVDGVEGKFCDPRAGTDGSCNSKSDCLSRNCQANRCAGAAGIANGGACQLSSHCASMNCVSGVCRGKSQIGDTCTTDTDCTVGCCKNSVCSSSC